jgi:hypothetical protein
MRPFALESTPRVISLLRRVISLSPSALSRHFEFRRGLVRRLDPIQMALVAISFHLLGYRRLRFLRPWLRIG